MELPLRRQPIHEQVKLMYETFPYPHYPLLAKPRWQEGYLASSLLQSKLAFDLLGFPLSVSRASTQTCPEVLIAGCGEIQPFVMRKLEPSSHRITCVDLSAKSLTRARIRLLGSFQTTRYISADINHYLAAREPKSIDHCEAYGVLHHLADPRQTAHLLFERLQEKGSLRLMVYNSTARHWILELQKVFRQLGLSPYQKKDLALARHFLELSSHHLPSLKAKLGCIGPATFDDDNRFIDTFFHVRELNLSPRRWLEIFEEAGFQTLGLFDRYGELDDLANPLWCFPSSAALSERSEDGRFENNLELFLYKNTGTSVSTHLPMRPIPFHLKRSAPPHAWFSFRETKNIPLTQRFLLWHGYLSYVWRHHYPPACERLLHKLPLPTLQRLARIGAILPAMPGLEHLRDDLMAPMEKHMQCPDRHEPLAAKLSPLKLFIEETLHSKRRFNRRRCDLILARIDRAQLTFRTV